MQVFLNLQTPSNNKQQVRFLGDPTAKWTEALDLQFDGSAIFGGVRGKRYALKIEDGKVKEAFVEPDNTGIDGMGFLIIYKGNTNCLAVSDAKKVLG
jgi:peroxiredoxin